MLVGTITGTMAVVVVVVVTTSGTGSGIAAATGSSATVGVGSVGGVVDSSLLELPRRMWVFNLFIYLLKLERRSGAGLSGGGELMVNEVLVPGRGSDGWPGRYAADDGISLKGLHSVCDNAQFSRIKGLVCLPRRSARSKEVRDLCS